MKKAKLFLLVVVAAMSFSCASIQPTIHAICSVREELNIALNFICQFDHATSSPASRAALEIRVHQADSLSAVLAKMLKNYPQ